MGETDFEAQYQLARVSPTLLESVSTDHKKELTLQCLSYVANCVCQ